MGNDISDEGKAKLRRMGQELLYVAMTTMLEEMRANPAYRQLLPEQEKKMEDFKAQIKEMGSIPGVEMKQAPAEYKPGFLPEKQTAGQWANEYLAADRDVKTIKDKIASQERGLQNVDERRKLARNELGKLVGADHPRKTFLVDGRVLLVEWTKDRGVCIELLEPEKA